MSQVDKAVLKDVKIGGVYVAHHDNGRGRYCTFVKVINKTQANNPRVQVLKTITVSEDYSDPCGGWQETVKPDLETPLDKSALVACRWTQMGFHIGDQYHFNGWRDDTYKPDESYTDSTIYA